MNLNQIDPQGFILALFIRDDGERFLLGTGAYQFIDTQLHFTANSYANDVVEAQGTDGVFLAGQVRRANTQVFDGFVGDSSSIRANVEAYRKEFLAFFRKNYYYTVVYVFNDGSAIQRRKGFIVDAPEIKELYQISPQYHIAFNFEDVNYYAYYENAEGQEQYGKSASIPITSGGDTGGFIWDAVGGEWDAVGAVWESGSTGGPTTVNIDSIDNVYPVWEVKGPAVNPQITIIKTNTSIQYSGTISSSETLQIDMFNKTALVNGVSMISNVSGTWLYLKPGNNRVTYTTNNTTAVPSKIKWQEIVG